MISRADFNGLILHMIFTIFPVNGMSAIFEIFHENSHFRRSHLSENHVKKDDIVKIWKFTPLIISVIFIKNANFGLTPQSQSSECNLPVPNVP